jgi:hypothetical protein
VYDLFNGRIQFMVPVYQRAYVWNEAENWGVLWEDIADTAERYIADPTAHVRQRHFLGPIVLDQQPVEAGGVDPRLVIDGQQRLTTLQIILSAAARVAEERGAADVTRELVELIFNRGRAAGAIFGTRSGLLGATAKRSSVWSKRGRRRTGLASVARGDIFTTGSTSG